MSSLPIPNSTLSKFEDMPAEAPNPMKLKFRFKTISRNHQSLIEMLNFRLMNYLERSRSAPKLKLVLDNVLAALVQAVHFDKQVLYSRRKGKLNKQYKHLIEVTSFLESEGLIVNVIGANNEYQGYRSYMIPTDNFANLVSVLKVTVALLEDVPMIMVRDNEKNELPLETIPTLYPLQVYDLSQPVKAYNSLWTRHHATLDGKPLVPFVMRIFNNKLDMNGRFYAGAGSHIGLKKHLRENILINGSATCEPDFKSLHICLLYAQVGIQLNPLVDDPYLIDGYERSTVKAIMLQLVNSPNLSGLKSKITRSGNVEHKAAYVKYQQDKANYERLKSQGMPTPKLDKPPFIDSFIEGLPDGINGGEFLEAFLAKHKLIADLFGSDNIGLKLQHRDSQIMSSILSQCCALDIPVLPVHDSVRCREEDLEQVVGIMLAAYKSVVGFKGCVDMV
ncbi:hypothetical protein [Vibrio sp. SCSIO 43136]|uniref:hypothetical protein n=1 Tax=Vibrio sp. SCSIO 43136 TaxID=2819101 RepID=UPI0020760ED6|nr:hypothetical protein [Vibrio sp. SCSIO 43136]USD64511.1 hypothetical protein J4N39_10400 [Vibrio sp. SCSIO 43136]